MKKLAAVFLLAVLLPSAGLAWLAVRSLKDQQFILERQQTLLYQGATDALAERLRASMGSLPSILAERSAAAADDARFDPALRAAWPLAAVGFRVSADGRLLAPAPDGDSRARGFRRENERFLTNRELAEVYQPAFSTPALAMNRAAAEPERRERVQKEKPAFSAGSRRDADLEIDKAATANAPAAATRAAPAPKAAAPAEALEKAPAPPPAAKPAAPSRKDEDVPSASAPAGGAKLKQSQRAASAPSETQALSLRNVQPQKLPPQEKAVDAAKDAAPARQLSQSVPEEAEFRQLLDADPAQEGGLIARFLQNKLAVLVWHRPPRGERGGGVFGAQLDLSRLAGELARELDAGLDAALRGDLALALLDDNGRPVAQTAPTGFQPPDWRRPFVATEIGDALPHWEVAAYLREPGKLDRAARDLRRTLGALVGLLLVAIGTGGALIGLDLRRQLRLARQKTDFVSNVSHELKTPLTSIRMFSELLTAGGDGAAAADPEKRGQYLRIIAGEAARLSRLIDNVLDFARLERGGKRYAMAPCDLGEVAAEVAASLRPAWEAGGRALGFEPPPGPVPVRGDRDALAQIALNLLSNAEKYGGAGPIVLGVAAGNGRATLSVLDRGPGVPAGCEEKVFAQFFRATDSLASGIPGSGLGLTLARRIAHAHGGEVRYRPRSGGGSEFTLEVPLAGDVFSHG